ncbi:MAG: ABC transporter ATP-binding protein [Geminicoccaceae bacterium]
MASLVIRDVDKVYRSRGKADVHAVRSLTMTIADGEIVGLLGSSGCGKTSTLRMIAGFEDITAGEITLGGRRLNDLAPSERDVAMAFEGYALYPPLRVRDNIQFALLRDRKPAAEVQGKVKAIADLLEIGDILDRYPPTISGGQQQRAGLARALVRSAGLTLLDEPMGQLEPQLRAILRARIKDWLITHGMTSVLVTHDQTEALALADRIAVMEGGRLMQLGTPAELKERPANLFVASFIGEPPMNMLDGTLQREDGRLRLAIRQPGGQPAFVLELPTLPEGLPTDRPVALGIRPHRIRVGDGPLSGTVVSNQWLGDQTHVGLDVGGCMLIAVTDGLLPVSAGDQVRLDLPPAALHLFDAGSGDALRHGLGAGTAEPRAAA